ncbi:hypothetical protein M4951_01875 [Blastopirellula sp. J2-11]|uniref:hypothetical protein n=1 Tax=Blastopirellula sp. J2-11 TaxID=2943192 RepID=UPI0021C66EC2|nr:hypothetical protein [Blastopirellula sp. J2-11]UUO07072.1 hypothetical protein M4951_01875 [Blastopirellula sp. J2-11]
MMQLPLPICEHAAIAEPQRYRSLTEFERQWREWDQPDSYLRIAIVVALEEHFSWPLSEAIRRKYRGLQLTIVTKTPRLPGLESRGDLALHCVSLGWQRIQFSQNWEEALEQQRDRLNGQWMHETLIPFDWSPQRQQTPSCR